MIICRRRKPNLGDLAAMTGEPEIERLTVPVWPDVGKALGLGRNATYNAISRGEIRVLRFGRRILVAKRELERLLNGEAS